MHHKEPITDDLSLRVKKTMFFVEMESESSFGSPREKIRSSVTRHKPIKTSVYCEYVEVLYKAMNKTTHY